MKISLTSIVSVMVEEPEGFEEEKLKKLKSQNCPRIDHRASRFQNFPGGGHAPRPP